MIALAQDGQGDPFLEIAPWLAALIALVVVGAMVITWLRRRLYPSDRDRSGSRSGFTLHELRALHRDGELSDEEFENARAAMLAEFGVDASATARGDADAVRRPDDDARQSAQTESDPPE